MKILFLPIDERFTTYELFCKYARVADIEVVTIPFEKMGLQKRPANKQEIIKIINQQISKIDSAVISAEMLLYGGLIPSRIDNETIESLCSALDILKKIREYRPDIQIYVSASVLRIPKTSSSNEEPDYYADFGKQIFEYSFHTHRYECMGENEDKKTADELKNMIPAQYLEDYLSRRKRHHLINMKLIEMVRKGIISYLAVGLDDNAEYGFNVKEGNELINASKDLQDKVLVRNGTDELQFPLLSGIVSAKRKVKILPVYFRPECKNNIPAFESSPLCQTVKKQIIAAGADVAENSNDTDIFCLIINSCLDKQPQAMSSSNVFNKQIADKLSFWLKECLAKAGGRGVVIADCSFTNGSDKNVIDALFHVKPDLDSFIYGAWNTVSNTIGSIIPLAVIKHFTMDSNERIKKLNVERLVEDWGFMVDARSEIIRYLGHSTDFDTYPIPPQHLNKCYEMAHKIMQKDLNKINLSWNLNYKLSNVHSLWKRTFEIAFEIID
jgi:hypothetical protein